MRVLAAVLVFTSACATTSGEGRADHDMAALFESGLFVAGAGAATYDCARDWDTCKWALVGSAAIATVIGGIAYGWSKYDRYENAQIDVHVRAPARPGDVGFVFTWRSPPDPPLGETVPFGGVLIDPATQGADLTARRSDSVCVAYAPRVDAPIDAVHCAPARPLLLFAP